MTDARVTTTAVVVPGSRDQVARARYRTRLRRWRVGYAVLIALAALVLGTVVKTAYSHGEISHATLHPVSSAPPSVPLRTPGATLQQAWTSSDRTAIGQPYWRGTVVTHDEHSIRGRDAQTGRTTWSYTRSDRTLCQAIQDQGVSIAVFEVNGNCDELTALDTDKGSREWTRTLDKDGAELNGHPSYVVTPYTVMLTTPGAVYAVDPSSGLDRWVFQQDGCSVRGAVLGLKGALISQTCAGRTCTDDLKFCGNGEQLLLRDATAGENTDSSKNKGNPDQIKWNLIGSNLVPASAGEVISAVSADGADLVVLGPDKGNAVRRLPLAQRSTTITDDAAADAEVLRIGNTSYAITGNRSAFSWHAATAAATTVTGKSGTGTPSLSNALLAVPTSTGIATLDPNTGAVLRSFAVPAPAAGSRAYPLGTGFLVAGTPTTYYR